MESSLVLQPLKIPVRIPVLSQKAVADSSLLESDIRDRFHDHP